MYLLVRVILSCRLLQMEIDSYWRLLQKPWRPIVGFNLSPQMYVVAHSLARLHEGTSVLETQVMPEHALHYLTHELRGGHSSKN